MPRLEPILRFPEFTGEWQERRLGEITVNKPSTITAGQLSDSFEGYAVYGASGIAGYVKSFQHEQPYTAVIKDGAGAGRLLWCEGETSVLSTLTVLLPRQGIDTGYLHYVLQGIDFSKYITGSTIPHVYYRDFSKAKLKVPTLEEQQKIAAFLAAVDKRVALLERKVQQLEAYKRGVMQQLFSQQLRFTRPDGSHFPVWQEIKFKDIFCRVTSKNKENNQNILTISAQHGFVSQDKFFSKIVAAKDVQGYYLLHENDYAYNKSYSKGYPVGAIKRLTQDKGVVSTLYICFSLRQPGSEVFFDQYFESGKHNREIQKIAQEGARNHGLLNMSIDDFFNTKLIVPSAAEQQKIAELLSALDEKIALTRQQLDKTKQFRKGLLQRMFV